MAVPTGFEPATSTLTGWRALRTALQDHDLRSGVQTRTENPPLNGRTLCRLSYTGIGPLFQPRSEGVLRKKLG